jgi:hypothetical protein
MKNEEGSARLINESLFKAKGAGRINARYDREI